MEIEPIGSPLHLESIKFNGKWVGESNIDLVVVKGLGILSNPHKIARLPLTTPRPPASQDSPSHLLPDHSISQNVKTAGDAEPDSGVPHRPQMSPLTAWSGLRSVFVFWEVVPRNRSSFGFFEGAREERTKRQLLL